MQIPAANPTREHEKPMSWPRAVLIAVGFFFVAAILLGQIPGFFYTIATLSTLSRWEASFLDFGALAVGMGLICLEIALLYDPRPLIPWPLFAGAGTILGLIGAFFDYQVFVGINATNVFGFSGWSEFLPEAIRNGQSVTYWPVPGQAYLLNPNWFQIESIDLKALGMIFMIIGAGMLVFAVLCPFILSGRLNGPIRDFLVRVSLGGAIVISGVWLTAYTFAPNSIIPAVGAHDPFGNALLFIAMLLALFALAVYVLPIMVERRQEFMPAVYLHGVVGLLGSVGIPLLFLWAVTYPIVSAIHSADSAQFWVQCSQVNVIPGSCTFTPFTGYLICAIVFTNLFALMMAGIYFWSTRRNTVVLGALIAIIYVGLAVSVLHVDEQQSGFGQFDQLPLGMIVAVGVLVLAFVFFFATQREIASTYVQQLGCMGQWLVLGTLMLFVLLGYCFLSIPQFFELESGLALFYVPGPHSLHDAFWGMLIVGLLAVWQLIFLMRRTRAPITPLRKFITVCVLVSSILLIASAVMGFHTDVLSQGINALEGSDAVAIGGMCFGLVAVLASLWGSLLNRGAFSAWTVGILVVALIGIAWAFIAYYFPGPFPELTIFGLILATFGAYAYAAAGPDYPEEPGMIEQDRSTFVVAQQ